MQNNIHSTYTFQQDKIYVFFFKNLLYISIVISIFIFFVAAFSGMNDDYILRVFHIIIIMNIIILIIRILLKKVAYKIAIDFEKKIIRFHLFSRKSVIEKNFSSLSRIDLNNHTVFVFNRNKIYFGVKRNHELQVSLNKLIGIICN